MRKPNLDNKKVCMDVKEYVDRKRNYRIPTLTSSDVACAIGISRTSLAKIMRQEMGMTFLQYLEQLRLQHAHHSITQRRYSKKCEFELSEKDIEHIALLTGFSTARTFKEKYKKKYGF